MDFQTNAAATVANARHTQAQVWKRNLSSRRRAPVYGNPKKLPIAEEDHTVPISPYGAGKLAVERYLDVYAKLYGLRSVSLRMFSPLGLGCASRSCMTWRESCYAIRPGSKYLATEARLCDFIYADDLVSAILCIVARMRTSTEKSIISVRGRRPRSVQS